MLRLPDNTRTIHFLANQNMSEFKEDDFRGKSEAEVMSVLEGSSGKMIYWARFACASDDESNIKEQLQTAGSAITMIRNQAQVSIDNWNTTGLQSPDLRLSIPMPLVPLLLIIRNWASILPGPEQKIL